jgi:hypothetical protein
VGRPLTATLLRRQSLHAPSFLISAAFSLCSRDKGPVRLLDARRWLETSEPSLTEKIDWCRLEGEVSALYDVLFVSADKLVAPDAEVAWVEMDELVSFLNGGESDRRCCWAAAAAATTATAAAAVAAVRDSSAEVFLGGASIRLGAGCILEEVALNGPSSAQRINGSDGTSPAALAEYC